MFSLPGFRNIELLLERNHVVVYRAFSEMHDTSVILKILRSEYPSQVEIDRYEKEYQLLKMDLGPGVPRALDLLQIGKTRVMVIEDIGGSKLQRELGGQVRSLENILSLSINIVSVLAKVHQSGIIHGDLNPDNIVSNEKTGRVQIIDFGLAEKSSLITADTAKGLHGTMRFISPEQTGRTQRGIDYRSDFYNLGVTLYYLFSGHYPFHASDDMEWVHQHVAKIETPLSEKIPDFPVSNSRVVQKLMMKAPDERYQSCKGLIYDLNACLEELRSGKTNPDFVAGSKNVPSEFRLAKRLYGRETETLFLRETLKRVVDGDRKLVLIAGDAGVGKTSLVNVIRSEVAKAQGYFVKGKYDQFQKDIPFSAFIQAFNELVNQILAESDEQIDEWRARLMDALEGNGHIVTEVIPKMEMIIGKQEVTETLRGNEQRQRFLIVFHKFIRNCCQRGIPLVIFLDDMQWADSASRSLISTFLTEGSAESLLFALAYRSREVDGSHPLRQMLRSLELANVKIDNIHLGELKKEDVLQMILDTFQSDMLSSASLADLIFDKTKGNPFFVAQFLNRLVELKVIHFDGLDGWVWDVKKINTLDATENVLALLTEKIDALPTVTRKTLQLAACLGNRFTLQDLQAYSQTTLEHNARAIDAAVSAGLVQNSEDGYFRFVHDRVHEATYQMTSVEERSDFHWKIAGHMLKTLSPEKIREDIFSVCNHWNAGSSFARTEKQRVDGARLNLLAAERAKDASVYDLALNYSKSGLKLLEQYDWGSYPNEFKSIYSMQAETLYSLGQFDQSEKIFAILLDRIIIPVERARIFRTKLELAHMMRRYEESIKWGAAGLAELNFNLPLNPSTLTLLPLLLRSRSQFAKMPGLMQNDQQVELPDEVELTLRLLGSISEPAFFLNKNLLIYCGLAALNISIAHGRIEWEATAFYATILWRKMNKFAGTAAFCKLAVPHLDLQPRSSAVARSLFVVGGFCLPFVESYKVAFRVLERAYHMLLQNGDLVYAGSTSLYIGSLHAVATRKLSIAEEEITAYIDALDKNGDIMIRDSLISVNLYLRCLLGDTEAPNSFSTPERSEDDWVTHLKTHKTPNARAWYGVHKMAALFVMGYGEEAVKYLPSVTELNVHSPFTCGSTMGRILGALVQMRYLPGKTWSERRKRLRGINKTLKFLKAASETTPQNFLAPYLMVKAEKCRAMGRVQESLEIYQQAVLAARNGDSPVYEALGCELLSDAYIAAGNEMIAMFYMREAFFAYESWGAVAKVQRLLERHPEFRLAGSFRSGSDTSRPRESSSQTNANLDVNSILKATNTLLAEMDMDRLIHKLLVILIQNAGADRGVLIMKDGKELMVKGEVQVTSLDNFKITNFELEKFSAISKPIVTYVSRTKEAKVVANAYSHEDFRKCDYTRKMRLRSVMCVPIMSQGELKGMVYLENNQSDAVFSADRLELIRVISGQAAISIENAKLYTEQGEKIRMENELATAQAVQESLFPAKGGEFAGVSVTGYYQPASECGGDWWYYSDVGDKVYVWIGDATGHGAPAALVTSAACSAVSILEKMPDLKPDRALSILNNAIYRTSRGNIQMTFFAGALDKKTGEFHYAKASHDPPLVIRKGVETTEFRDFRKNLEMLVSPNGPRLGSRQEEAYETGVIQLGKGDQVLLYTDGLTELLDAKEEMWGERRFLQAVHKACSETQNLDEVVHQVVIMAEDFSAGVPLKDDITICLLKFSGT